MFFAFLAPLLCSGMAAQAQTQQYDEAMVERLRQFDERTRVDTSLTIGEVAGMSAADRLAYVGNVAARRGLELGIEHGNGILNCLQEEFVGIEEKADGSFVYPRGLDATIRLVHRHNNNGGEALSAFEQINEIVDLVAQHACGLPKG